MATLPKQEFNQVMDVFEQNYDTALKVLAYIAAQEKIVTTPMLISAGLLTGQEVNYVRAVVTVLGWAWIYPCGKTCKWGLTEQGKQKVKRYSQYSQ